MICNRMGCSNKTVHRESKEHGPICDECFRELLYSNIPVKTFMDSWKGDYGNELRNREQRLNRIFNIYVES